MEATKNSIILFVLYVLGTGVFYINFSILMRAEEVVYSEELGTLM